MSMSSTSIGAAPRLGASDRGDEHTAGERFVRGLLIWLALLLLLFVGAYSVAWFRAARLSASFMAHADASYAAGNYLESLTGYEEFDRELNRYVTYGGYMKVLNIWANGSAWPKPASTEQARARIDEVLQQHLTAEQAEGFIQANIGKQNPYMGTIFLRLGELYEEEGDIESARQVYDEVDELFPGEADLIARANERLAALGQ
jgi:tetratricopeptide (TPR) repeat protein